MTNLVTERKKHKDIKALYDLGPPVPTSDYPVVANFDSSCLTVGAGVAIFHIATSRVVLCYHSVKKFWFLPKGRRDANEDSGSGAEREGFEESGYRNRLLPIPLAHHQPQPHKPCLCTASAFVIEPVWTQLVPVTHTIQYILYWYIAETVPPDVEASLQRRTTALAMAYQCPPKYPVDLTLAERGKLEPDGYEPVRHENTGVDAEEALYESYLLPIKEAINRLEHSVSADVVQKGWAAICQRRDMEKKADVPQ